MRARVLLIAVAMLAMAGCGTTTAPPSNPPPPAITPAPPQQSSSPAAQLTSACAPAMGTTGIAGWTAYSLTLHNPGGSPVQVVWVAVVFSDANGQEIGSDDPAQENYPGVQTPVTTFTTTLIAAGQSVTVPMETNVVSSADSNWTCALGEWSSL